MGEKMHTDEDGVRDIGSPFKVFSPLDMSSLYDVDFAPQPVSVRDVHPSELAANPKDEESSSAQESVEDSTTPEKSNSPDPLENPAPVEREPVPTGLEDLVSSNETSPGDETPPAATPPLPPGKTPSSRSAVKSN